MNFPLRTASFAVLATVVTAAPAADRVESLPGWSESLPSPWYSGFLSFGKKHLHYVLVEAEPCAVSPPLVLWMNGGPGCSSMDALLYEHGPLLINEDGTQLVRNPHAWTKVATMLYLEAPIGVGFSYSDDANDTQHLNDEQTATDNLAALKAFFQLFPEYKTHDFYVSGESYGGVYVPTLSLKIFEDPSVDWQMRGFLVGNGVFDWKLMAKSSIPFLYGHGALSSKQMAEIDRACKEDLSSKDEECQKLQDQAQQNAAGLNFYDIYRDCFQAGSGLKQMPLPTARRIAGRPELLLDVIQAPRPPHPALGMSPPCIDSVGGTEWLKKTEVKKALHVDLPQIPEWTICSTSIHYTRNMSYSAPHIYALMKDKYRILVFNGDTDMACDYLADQWAVASINATLVSEWEPWKIKDAMGFEQTAGFVTSYKVGGELHFMTVKGAGHMVPQWKPEAALAMFSRFLVGSDLRTGAGGEVMRCNANTRLATFVV